MLILFAVLRSSLFRSAAFYLIIIFRCCHNVKGPPFADTSNHVPQIIEVLATGGLSRITAHPEVARIRPSHGSASLPLHDGRLR